MNVRQRITESKRRYPLPLHAEQLEGAHSLYGGEEPSAWEETAQGRFEVEGSREQARIIDGTSPVFVHSSQRHTHAHTHTHTLSLSILCVRREHGFRNGAAQAGEA